MTPQPRILYQSHRLACPICQREGDCEAHLVETWQEGHRTEHLMRALGGHPDAFRLKQQLQERHARPEQCFPGCAVVEHHEDMPESHQPLFSGKAVVHSPKNLRWFSLFHQEGPHLLMRHRALVRSLLERSNRMRHLLHTLRQGGSEPTLTSQSVSASQAPESSSRQLQFGLEAEAPDYVYTLAQELSVPRFNLPGEEMQSEPCLQVDEIGDLAAGMADWGMPVENEPPQTPDRAIPKIPGDCNR